MDGNEVRDRPRPGTAVTIGNFDGVHRGHRLLVAKTIEVAERSGLTSVVLTFDRHPATVVRPASAPRLLTSVAQKLDLLEATGVDEVVVLRFDAERAAEAPEDFVRSVLVEELSARVVVVGASFRFGHGARGDVALLESMGRELGFEVMSVDLVADGSGEPGGVVSSSRIRTLVAGRRLLEASRLLGRPHEVLATRRSLPGAGAHENDLELEVAPELLVPPPGTYLGDVALLHDGRPADGCWRSAQIVVLPASPPGSPPGDGGPVSPASTTVTPPTELVVRLRGDGVAACSDPMLLRADDVAAVRFTGPRDLEGQ